MLRKRRANRQRLTAITHSLPGYHLTMTLRIWMYDIAREQSPGLAMLRRLCQFSLDSGYNALGLYSEHRFAWPATPWANGKGVVTVENRVYEELCGLSVI